MAAMGQYHPLSLSPGERLETARDSHWYTERMLQLTRLVYGGFYLFALGGARKKNPSEFAESFCIFCSIFLALTCVVILFFVFPGVRDWLPVSGRSVFIIVAALIAFGSMIGGRGSFFGIRYEGLEGRDVSRAKALALIFAIGSPLLFIFAVLIFYA